jgi:hypothetical protein
MIFFMSVGRESNFFFKHRVDQKYFLYIHEIKDICIRDENANHYTTDEIGNHFVYSPIT